MKKLSLYELAKMFLYIGAVGYGGPAIMAQIKKEIVDVKKWISKESFLDALGFAQILPGSTGVSVVTSIGYQTRGVIGAIISVIMFLLPATATMIALTWAYFTFGNMHFVQSLMTGLGALVVALLVNATLKLGKTVFDKLVFKDIKGFIIATVAFIGTFFLNINVIIVILVSAFLSFIFYNFTNDFKKEKNGVMNDTTEVLLSEKNIHWHKADFIAITIVIIPLIIITTVPLWRQIFITFFNIGLFAFGGGFTAVTLIQHQVVNSLHWVNLTQFRDGIALGQVTPGPVLITATFIGYKLAGILGACVGTIAVFSPMAILTIVLFNVHSKIKELRIIKIFIKGILSGFIGLLIAVTLQFGIKSLINWQTWLLFIVSLIIILYFKKDTLWAILGTIILSLILL